MEDDRSHAIAVRAYEIWERSGRPPGKHDEHWAQAEREILGAAAAARGKASDEPAGTAPQPAGTPNSGTGRRT